MVSPFYGCEDGFTDDMIKLEEIKVKLASQSSFAEYSSLIYSISSEKWIKDDVTLDQHLINRLSNVESIDELISKTRPYLVNPQAFEEIVKETFAKKREVIRDVPELNALSNQEF